MAPPVVLTLNLYHSSSCFHATMKPWVVSRVIVKLTSKFSCNPCKRSFTSSSQNRNGKLTDILLTIPIEKKGSKLNAKNHRSRDQRTRTRTVLKDKWCSPSKIYLQVLGTGANGTPRALFVFTSHQRYLFNCGEGTERIAEEHGIQLAMVKNIFITHRSWDNVGGSRGFQCNILDSSSSRRAFINLHGPPRIENVYQMQSSFLKLEGVEINKYEYSDQPFEDDSLIIESVPIFSTQAIQTRHFPRRNVTEENGEIADSYRNERSTSPTSKSYYKHDCKRQMSPSSPVVTYNRDVSMAFICKAHAIPGSLSMLKCLELNVPFGPLFEKLKDCEDVTLDDGTVVLWKDAWNPEERGPIFIIVECPTVNFLDSLVNAPQFKLYQATAESKSDYADVVVHFTPYDVINHPKYKEWIRRFMPQTQHILLNDKCPGIANKLAYRIQQKLNLIHPEIFPLLNSENQTKSPDIVDEDENVTLGEPLLEYHLRPNTQFDRSKIISIQSDEYLQELKEIEGLTDAFDELKKSVKRSQNEPVSDRDYPEVTFLGTNSSMPRATRNVSSILIHSSSSKCMLLDCGEGTYGQILRFYGKEETTAILKKLSLIFISHEHADHNAGLIKILHERRTAFELSGFDHVPKLYLLAPRRVQLWLNQYNNEFSRIFDQYIYIWNKFMRHGFQHELDGQNFAQQALLKRMDMKELKCVDVFHCNDAYGIIFIHKDGWKLGYSGDTMPCDNLIKAGENCDLLIHEATMENDLLQEAIKKAHSTTSQAIEVGRKMNARFTMLTHFSSRYTTVPLLTDEFPSGVGVAFDNMKVSLRNLCLTPLFIPILKIMFNEDHGIAEVRGLRRKWRQEHLEAAMAKQAKQVASNGKNTAAS